MGVNHVERCLRRESRHPAVRNERHVWSFPPGQSQSDTEIVFAHFPEGTLLTDLSACAVFDSTRRTIACTASGEIRLLQYDTNSVVCRT